MGSKIYRLIDKSLDLRVSPAVYLVCMHSLITGASFVFFPNHPSVTATLLFQYGALVGVSIWGWLVLIGCLLAIVGMLFRQKKMAGAGGTIMFGQWCFALIAYALNGAWLQTLLALVLMLIFGYISLAASLDRLWDYTPNR